MHDCLAKKGQLLKRSQKYIKPTDREAAMKQKGHSRLMQKLKAEQMNSGSLQTPSKTAFHSSNASNKATYCISQPKDPHWR